MRRYLADAGIDDKAVFQRVQHVIVLTLLALWPKVPRQGAGFELFGFDVMIDQDLNPWLIEVRCRPRCSPCKSGALHLP